MQNIINRNKKMWPKFYIQNNTAAQLEGTVTEILRINLTRKQIQQETNIISISERSSIQKNFKGIENLNLLSAKVV